MKKRIILGTILVAMTMALVMIPTLTSAATLPTPLYFGVIETKPNYDLGLGYAIGDPRDNQSAGAKIWNIVQFKSNSFTDPTETNDLYCIRAGHGFSDTSSK